MNCLQLMKQMRCCLVELIPLINDTFNFPSGVGIKSDLVTRRIGVIPKRVRRKKRWRLKGLCVAVDWNCPGGTGQRIPQGRPPEARCVEKQIMACTIGMVGRFVS